MKYYPYLLCALLLCVNVNAQLTHGGVLTPFNNCPDENVIAFKNGTSCTANPYNFYRLDQSGNLIGGSLFSTTNTQEINAFGICNADKFIYGFLFDRTGSCIFDNIHFIRLGLNGVYNDLGTISLPSGYSLNTANGCTTMDGNFIFSATNGTDFYVCIVTNITAMTDNPAYAIPASLRLINFNTVARKFSDWAVHPNNGKIYTYGMFTENGKSKGQLVEINLNGNNANGMGAVDSVLLTDPTRDNFGGVFFGQDNNIYGANVFDRKLYKVDFNTGALSVAGNIAGGSGQFRCDMGSCAAGLLILPVKITAFALAATDNKLLFTWNIHFEAATIAAVLEQSTDGVQFNTVAAVTNNSYRMAVPAVSTWFRLRVSNPDGSSLFSQVVLYKASTKNMSVCHAGNQLNIHSDNTTEPLTMALYSITGNLLQQHVFNGSVNYSLQVPAAPAGNIVVVKLSQGSNNMVQKMVW